MVAVDIDKDISTIKKVYGLNNSLLWEVILYFDLEIRPSIVYKDTRLYTDLIGTTTGKHTIYSISESDFSEKKRLISFDVFEKDYKIRSKQDLLSSF